MNAIQKAQFARDVLKRIRRRGPSRIVVDSEGYAVPPQRAAQDHDTQADIVFVRNNGWSLGAPLKLRMTAYGMWADAWVGCILPDGNWVLIETYKRIAHTL